MRFYLGTHLSPWLHQVTVPLFVSHMRLRVRKRFKPATCEWALDSGAFSQVAAVGHFIDTPQQYVSEIERYADDLGGLQWAAPQDHMTEPAQLHRSDLANTVQEAQLWTVRNYCELQSLGCSVPIIPVLQGQTLHDYFTHMEMYADAGADLHSMSTVGLGSVCKRTVTPEIVALVKALHHDGLKLHGFGMKLDAIASYGSLLASADSMAWSYTARVERTTCDHGTNAKLCNNCMVYAMAWRDRVIMGAC